MKKAVLLLAVAGMVFAADAQRAAKGVLRDSSLIVTNEQDAAALSAFNSFTNEVRVSVANDRANRASEDARVLGIASNLFDAAQAARLAGDTNLAAVVETYRTNLLQHFTALVDAERAARATNVSAWADALGTESRATNAVTRALATNALAVATNLYAAVQRAQAAADVVATNPVTRVMSIDGMRWIDGSNVSWRVEGGYYAWYLSVPERGFLSEIIGYRGNETTDIGIEGGPESVSNASPYTVQFYNMPMFGWSGVVSLESDTYLWGLSSISSTNIVFEPSQNTLSNAAVWRAWIAVTTSRVELVDAETKEFHTDSYTNLVWKTIFSNGWMIQRAYTNLP